MQTVKGSYTGLYQHSFASYWVSDPLISCNVSLTWLAKALFHVYDRVYLQSLYRSSITVAVLVVFCSILTGRLAAYQNDWDGPLHVMCNKYHGEVLYKVQRLHNNHKESVSGCGSENELSMDQCLSATGLATWTNMTNNSSSSAQQNMSCQECLAFIIIKRRTEFWSSTAVLLTNIVQSTVLGQISSTTGTVIWGTQHLPTGLSLDLTATNAIRRN